jgi:uncharacterized protein with von Willebrand factor type A (vWA) domain
MTARLSGLPQQHFVDALKSDRATADRRAVTRVARASRQIRILAPRLSRPGFADAISGKANVTAGHERGRLGMEDG